MKDASPARACGIDFGTSNSTVGWLRPGMETLIALEDDKITQIGRASCRERVL